MFGFLWCRVDGGYVFQVLELFVKCFICKIKVLEVGDFDDFDVF